MVRLTVHDDRFVARDPIRLEQRREIGAQAQRALLVHQVEPIEVHRTGNVTVARGRRAPPSVLVSGPAIPHDERCIAEAVEDVGCVGNGRRDRASAVRA